MSISKARKPLMSATLAICLCMTTGGVALSKDITGKLGTAGVAVSVSVSDQRGGKLVVVKRNGRDYAKYSAPAGTQEIRLCCSFGKCIPITSFQICDVVVNCLFPACNPQ